MKRTILIIITLSLLIGCKSNSEVIIFSSSRSGNSGIYKMDIMGENLKTIVNTKYEEWGPTFLDKHNITFLRATKKETKRFRVNINSLEEVEINQPPNCILDDKNALYNHKLNITLYECKGNIFVWDETNNTVKNITGNLSGRSAYPIWSHDEDNIIFTNNSKGYNDIYCYKYSDKTLYNLTNNSSNDERGDLSPDNNFLVFSSNRNSNNQDLYILNIENGNLKNITNSKGTELIARWSNDEKAIIYGSDKDGNWEIYKYIIKKGKTIRLTDNPSFDGDPRTH